MNNLDMFNLLHETEKQRVLNSLNATQTVIGNTPITWQEWNTYHKDVAHSLLEQDSYFTTLIQYIYTKMMVWAEKKKNEQSRNYTEAYIKSLFNLGMISNRDYGLAVNEISSIKKKVGEFWKLVS